MKSIPVKKAWQGEADCRHCMVRNSALFAGLTEADFGKIHQPIDDIAVPVHGLLYRTGEHGSSVYTLRSGILKLVQYLPDGSQRIVRLLKDADTVGLEALIGQPYQHDAVALSPLEVCRIPVEIVERLSQQSPELHRELLSRWHRALAQADNWLTHFSTGTARQRVARLLLCLAESSADSSLRLFGREDIGAMLGITTETASRMIAEFKRQGMLKEQPGGKTRVDAQGLRPIAEGD